MASLPLGAQGLGGGGGLGAQPEADRAVLEREGLEVALEAAQSRIRELEDRLGKEGESAMPLEMALAEANQEAEDYRTRYRDLLLRVEALGLESVESEQALQQRLIKAVRERQEFSEKHQAALEQLMALSESVMEFMKSASGVDPEARLQVEAELRRSDEALGFRREQRDGAGTVRDLNNGKVIGYKRDLRLAILDLGRSRGARVGLPVSIFRKDRLVASALVVDVRDSLSGAIVQEIFRDGDDIEVTDRVEPTTGSSLQL